MAKRSTIDLVFLVEWGNKQLAIKEHSAEFKNGVSSVITKALMEANQYQGFMYLDNSVDHSINGPHEFDRKYFIDHLKSTQPKFKQLSLNV